MNPQQTIAHYRINAKLGAGGMGEVWRATDTKLNREVAIKVLPEAFAGDRDRMARFTREAQVLASLNHPNIAAIYGVEERALVMELVEGPTLAERIAQGAIPLDEALPLASQLAEALECAHERGVIHRDLKPANIKITPSGRVKVLDFGLAKAMSSEAGGSSHPDASPTLTIGSSMPGMILGTAAYMAPEQARGRPVDKRVDIWAFGVVLYEMLTGERMFRGDDVSEILAAVIKEDPPLDRAPAAARRLLQRCLEKDPKKRLRDIGDAMPLVDLAPGTPAPTRRGVMWPAIAAAAILGAAALAWVHFREARPPVEVTRFQIPLPPGNGVWISPNGRRLCYWTAGTDGRGFWIREMDSLDAHRLRGSEPVAGTAFWSPDSRFIVYAAGGKLKKIDASGGLPQDICDWGTLIGGSWSRQGTIIVGTSGGGGIGRTSESGGSVTRLTSGTDFFPSFLPDGRHFVYLHVAAPEDTGIYLGTIDAAPERQSRKRLIATTIHTQYVPSSTSGRGYILFYRDGSVLAQPFDEGRLELAGEAIPLAQGVGTYAASALYSASDNGVLAFRAGTGAVNRLAWYDRQGKLLDYVGEPGLYSDAALSPDGTRAAFSRYANIKGSGMDLWLFEVARRSALRFTLTPGLNVSPVWSPDGATVVYTRAPSVFRQPAGGTGPEEVVFDRPASPDDWSRDGRYLLYSAVNPSTGSDLWALPDPTGPAASRKPFVVLNTRFNENMGQFSPDGRWIAYVSDESGRPEVYVRPFPPSSAGGSQRAISQGGGDQPRWRRDGKEILYFTPDGTLMSAEVSVSPAFTASTPHALFRAPVVTVELNGMHVRHWDTTAGGKRFLIDIDAAGPPAPATVVVNWPAALKK